MNIAQNLKKLMDSRGLSNSRLAREIHVHTSTVSNWLDGKDVKSENLEALCEYFGCSMDYLTKTTLNEKKSSVNGDEELTEYLEQLRTRPEMKMLFQLTKSATKEDVEKAVKIIETLLDK